MNTIDGDTGQAPDHRRVIAFQQVLQAEGASTVRQRRGIDVDAGCGQLADGNI